MVPTDLLLDFWGQGLLYFLEGHPGMDSLFPSGKVLCLEVTAGTATGSFCSDERSQPRGKTDNLDGKVKS